MNAYTEITRLPENEFPMPTNSEDEIEYALRTASDLAGPSRFWVRICMHDGSSDYALLEIDQ